MVTRWRIFFIKRSDVEYLRIWDVKNQRLMYDIPTNIGSYQVTPKWANERIIFTVDDSISRRSSRVQGYDVASRKPIWEFITPGSPSAPIDLFELSPDGENILVGANTSSPEIWGNGTLLDWDQSLLFFKVLNDKLTPTEIANFSSTYARLSDEDKAIIDGRTGNAFSLQVELGAEETKIPEPKEPPRKREREEAKSPEPEESPKKRERGKL
jgi:hypothetical protein